MKKKFNCVEMMHRGAARVKRETAGMTIDEEVEYWRQRTEELRERQRQAREARKSA